MATIREDVILLRQGLARNPASPETRGLALRLSETLERLSQRVGQRLERSGARGRTVTVKLRLADFTTFTRSTTVSGPVGDARHVGELAQPMLAKETGPGRRFRLLGVGVSNFTEEVQLSLFE